MKWMYNILLHVRMAQDCVRQVANWSYIAPSHKFDKSGFDPDDVLKHMAAASPKMEALFEKIESLDARDQTEHGKKFKHMIFSDVKSMGYGAKILMAGFLAKGYHAVYDHRFKLDEKALEKTKGRNVALLCSTAVYSKPIGVRFRKAMLQLYNRRPDNVYGDYIRFIILDQGFKEGIDLFDVKYVHLFEPLLSRADEKQAIGRGTRFCGQKGLVFHPSKGWPLQVIRYDVEVPDTLRSHIGADTLSQLYLMKSGMDMTKITLANELEKVIMEAAVDNSLTEAVHHFHLPNRSQKGGKKKKRAALHPKAPTTKKTFENMQTYIEERFMKYKWPEAELENMCGYAGPESLEDLDKPLVRKKARTIGGQPSIVTLTPTQEFVRHYFEPQSPYKGLLLQHSVGTGKTCSAIAVATTGWEPRGYTILWVTRHTLKADIWKNMFQQVCSLVIKQQLRKGEIDIPDTAVQTPLKYLSNHWMAPISFKQLSNLCLGKNDIYREMVKRNGEKDPLKKTLIILDEAHKLFASDVAGAERPNADAIKTALHHSYDVSGKESARVLLMTATPYTTDPMDMMKLMNLIREPSEQLPETMEDFEKAYLNEEGTFTEEGKTKFKDDITGMISYLNREKDARQFAYPIYDSVVTPMSRSAYMEKQAKMKSIMDELTVIQQNVAEGKKAITEAKKKAKAEEKMALLKCKDVPVKERKQCKEGIHQKFATFQQELLGDLETKTASDSQRILAMKEEIKDIKQEKKDKKSDMSQEYQLQTRCEKK